MGVHGVCLHDLGGGIVQSSLLIEESWGFGQMLQVCLETALSLDRSDYVCILSEGLCHRVEILELDAELRVHTERFRRG